MGPGVLAGGPCIGFRLDVPRGFGSESPVTDLLSLAPPEAETVVAQWLTARGEPSYRARQIVPRLWQRPVATWGDASDLPAGLRAALDAEFPLSRLTLAAREVSADGTEKFLWRPSHRARLASD